MRAFIPGYAPEYINNNTRMSTFQRKFIILTMAKRFQIAYKFSLSIYMKINSCACFIALGLRQSFDTAPKLAVKVKIWFSYSY